MGVLLGIFTNHKIRFEKAAGCDTNVSEALDNLSNSASAVGGKFKALLAKVRE